MIARRYVVLLSVALVTVLLQARQLERLWLRSEKPEVRVGTRPPPLPLPSPNAASQPTYKVVTFWASWCLPCRVELPEIQRFAFDWNLRNPSASVIVVAVNQGERPLDVEEITKEFKAFLFLFDSNGQISSTWGVAVLPSTFLLAQDGTLINSWRGFDPELAKALRRHLRSDSARKP